MNNSNKLLSDLVTYRTYARYLPYFQRRESYEEIVNRCMLMHLQKFPKLSKDITKAFSLVHDYKVMPSMRSLQFAGEAITKNNLRSYNCSAAAIDDPRVFSEALFVLLSGTGFGFSVQKHHINKLPTLKLPRQEGVFRIQDSIHGWAQALQVLVDAYFSATIRPVFEYGDISARGVRLVATGAKAPGPGPLKLMLEAVEKKLKAAIGRKLKSIEVHDIICIVSDCVVSGGIRRAALLSLFDRDDEDMLRCKQGKWWEDHPYRARANNSAVLPRSEITKEEFDYIFRACALSGSGEPGFLFRDDVDMLANPCVEIALNSLQLCNLTSVVQTGLKDKKDFLRRVYNAALIGTLQAAYTDFPFVRDGWRQITEKEALLGVSFTGIADTGDSIPEDWLQEAAKLVLETNEKYAKLIGINVAARATSLKPEGTLSCVVGSSSGIHDRHAEYYLRRFQINKTDDLYHYLKQQVPDLVEDYRLAQDTAVITIPQESPKGALLRENTSALQLFDRALKYNKNWVAPGHRYSADKHNVSVTISVKDNEWETLREVMWANRNDYSGISLLPFDGGSYQQAPFETCTQETYENLSKVVKGIDLREVREIEDTTQLNETVSCVGGACELDWSEMKKK